MLMLQIMLFVISSGASVKVRCDADKNLKGIFFQDQAMMEAYPELVGIDTTYKLITQTSFASVFNAL